MSEGTLIYINFLSKVVGRNRLTLTCAVGCRRFVELGTASAAAGAGP